MNIRLNLRVRHAMLVAVIALGIVVLARAMTSSTVPVGGASSYSAAPGTTAVDVNAAFARRIRFTPTPRRRSGSASATAAAKITPTPTRTPTAAPTRTPTRTRTAAAGASAITPTVTPSSGMAIPGGETVVPIPPTATATTRPTTTPAATATATRTATATVPAGALPQLIFGLGPTADTARTSQLAQQATLGMYTTWYNGPGDLNWMKFWKNTLIPQTYASGRALHLIVYSGDAETGTPCGRQYPISTGINADMVQLAQTFAGTAGSPPLYVTLFTEFQTYPCTDNQWSGAEAYYTQLQAKMIQIRDIFHENAPNSQVSMGWGGWQTRWDAPASGAGRSLFPHFAATMNAMDFQSVQAMQGDTNVNDVRQMTQMLGAYGPVMLAHHKPDGFHPAVFDADITSMMTDAFLNEMTGYGLFAWSFMDQQEMASSTAIFNHVRDAVIRYGRQP